MSSEGRLTVLLGDGRCNVLVQVFEVGRKLPLPGYKSDLRGNGKQNQLIMDLKWKNFAYFLLPQYEWSSLAEKFD